MFKATSCIIVAGRFVCVRVSVVTEAGKSWAGFDRLIVCIICNRCSRGANVPFWLAPASFFGSSFAPKGFACCWWHRSMLVGQFLCVCVIPCPSVYAGTYLFNSKTNEIHDSINAVLPAIAEMVKKFKNIEKTGMLYLYVRVTQKIAKNCLWHRLQQNICLYALKLALLTMVMMMMMMAGYVVACEVRQKV